MCTSLNVLMDLYLFSVRFSLFLCPVWDEC